MNKKAGTSSSQQVDEKWNNIPEQPYKKWPGLDKLVLRRDVYHRAHKINSLCDNKGKLVTMIRNTNNCPLEIRETGESFMAIIDMNELTKLEKANYVWVSDEKQIKQEKIDDEIEIDENIYPSGTYLSKVEIKQEEIDEELIHVEKFEFKIFLNTIKHKQPVPGLKKFLRFLNKQDVYGKTPIHVALEARNIRAVNYFISKNANLLIANKNGITGLSLILDINDDKTLPNLKTSILLEKKQYHRLIKLIAIYPANIMIKTEFRNWIIEENLYNLLDALLMFPPKTEARNSLLLYAISKDKVDCVKVLLQNHADPTYYDKFLRTTLISFAINSKCNIEIIKMIYLMHPTILFVEDPKGEYPLYLALSRISMDYFEKIIRVVKENPFDNNLEDIFNKLLKKILKENKSLLTEDFVIYCGKYFEKKLIKRILGELSEQSAVNVLDHLGPLIFTENKDFDRFFKIAIEGKKEFLYYKLLDILYKCDVNSTLLIRYCSPEVFEKILQSSLFILTSQDNLMVADVENLKCSRIVAALKNKEAKKMLEIIIQDHGDLNCKSFEGISSLEYALGSNKKDYILNILHFDISFVNNILNISSNLGILTSLLNNYPTDTSVFLKRGHTTEISTFNKLVIDSKTFNPENGILFISKYCSSFCIEQFLLKYDEKYLYETYDSNGNTPCHLIALYNNQTVMKFLIKKLKSYDIFKKKNNDGNNILHLSNMNENHTKIIQDIIRCFEKFPEEIESKNNKNETALLIAAQLQPINVFDLLHALRRSSITINDCDDNTFLHKAALNSKHNVLAMLLLRSDARLLFDKKNKNNETPLHFAIKYGTRESVKALCDRLKNFNPYDYLELSIMNLKQRTYLELFSKCTKVTDSSESCLINTLKKAALECNSETVISALKSQQLKTIFKEKYPGCGSMIALPQAVLNEKYNTITVLFTEPVNKKKEELFREAINILLRNGTIESIKRFFYIHSTIIVNYYTYKHFMKIQRDQEIINFFEKFCQRVYKDQMNKKKRKQHRK